MRMTHVLRFVSLSLPLLLGPSWAYAASPIPKKPLPEQKRAPCDDSDGEYEMEGSCWNIYRPRWDVTDEQVRQACEDKDNFELSPGDCLKNKRLVLPVKLENNS